MPDNRVGSKVRGSVDGVASTFCSPNEQPSDLAQGKKKGQVPLEAAAAPNKVSIKASTSKAMKERRPPKVKADTSRVLSSKEKVQYAAVSFNQTSVLYKSHYIKALLENSISVFQKLLHNQQIWC